MLYFCIMLIMFLIYPGQEPRKKYPFPLENTLYISYKTLKVVFHARADKHAKIFEKQNIENNFKKTISQREYKDYNIIAIFLEGTSSTVLSESLTPYFKKFQKQGINIINYFNHTAATFRGLRGQFISGYSLKGGLQYNRESPQKLASDVSNIASIESLPSILGKHGYTTVFLSPHNKNDRLAPLMKNVGFQQVRTAENFGDKFDHLLTDRQSYQLLWKELMVLKSAHRPFFLCMYQLGTHHGMDSPDKIFGDGSNPYLNKFHNADFWLGNFVERFMSDSIFDNTILILTTDHATFPTPEYRETFHTRAYTFFDEIPFLILIKGISGKTFDAQYKNTLAFAPTVLDILGISDFKNHFLGESLFLDKNDNAFLHLSCIEYECYHTGKDGVQKINSDIDKSSMELIEKFYSFGG